MDTDKCLSKTAITIGEDTIENVEHFEYLGASFYGDGRSKNEIRRRLAIAKQKLTSTHPPPGGEMYLSTMVLKYIYPLQVPTHLLQGFFPNYFLKRCQVF